MRIGVDIDDVLVDALPQFLAAFGTAVPLEVADWDLFRAFPDIPPAARRAFWMRLEEEGFLFQRLVRPERRPPSGASGISVTTSSW